MLHKYVRQCAGLSTVDGPSELPSERESIEIDETGRVGDEEEGGRCKSLIGRLDGDGHALEQGYVKFCWILDQCSG